MKHKRGIIKLIILVVAAVVALAYFKVDLRAWAENIENWWLSQDLTWFKSQIEALVDRFR